MRFSPPFWLKNAHLQTIIASSGLRNWLIKRRAAALLAQSESLLLHSSKGIRLQANIARASNTHSSRKLAIVFHGWEGSADSSYVLASGQQLLDQDYTVCRLNLRDHGDTHHLNRHPFNSVRLDEVCDAIINLYQRFPADEILLLGFSLGGNFVLRLAGDPRLNELPLRQSIAVCPAIDPVHSSATIVDGHLYHGYFVKKWRHSLRRKYQYFPEIMRSHDDLKHKNLHQMNAVFVPLHTDYDEANHYLSAYAITQQTLDRIRHNSHIIYADDDPIIAATDFDDLQATEHVSLWPQARGGHCAFLQDIKLHSWINTWLKQIISG